MTQPKNMAQPAGHNSYPPPSFDQAVHSGQHLGLALLGREDIPLNDKIWHATTVASYGISQGFPVTVSSAPGDGGDVEEQAKQHFAALAAAQSSQAPAGFDWVTAVQLAWQLIQLWLRRRQPA